MFGQIYGEDTHDIWLKALMDYGWLGFASWAIMVGWTIAAGFKLLFRDRPWQGYLLCAYVVFVGHVFLGTIIDTDHWRHFYLLLGMVWGCIALEYRYQRGMLSRHRAAARRADRPSGGGAAAGQPRQPLAALPSATHSDADPRIPVDRLRALTIDSSRSERSAAR